jgi:hypothetical protein
MREWAETGRYLHALGIEPPGQPEGAAEPAPAEPTEVAPPTVVTAATDTPTTEITPERRPLAPVRPLASAPRRPGAKLGSPIARVRQYFEGFRNRPDE